MLLLSIVITSYFGLSLFVAVSLAAVVPVDLNTIIVPSCATISNCACAGTSTTPSLVVIEIVP